MRRRSSLTFPALLACALLAALFVAPLRADVPATLIGPDLMPFDVALQGLGNDKISFFGQDGTLVLKPLGDYLQLRNLPGASVTPADGAADSNMWIALTDGQKLYGTWQGVGDDADHFLWQHRLLGKTTIALNRLTTLSTRAEAPASQTTGADVAWLANGDQLEGFVAGVFADGLLLQPQGAAEKTPLALERLTAVSLANPMQPKRDSHLLVLADGNRIAVSEMRTEGQSLQFRAALAPKAGLLRVPLAEVVRIDLASSQGRLADLTDATLKVTAGGQALGVALPVRFEGRDVCLHAPITVAIELPPGARRFAATAVVDVNPGDPARAWTDFTLRLRHGQRLLAEQQFTRQSPPVALNVELPANTLTLELDPGVNGPVMDRLRLRDVVIFVENADAPRNER